MNKQIHLSAFLLLLICIPSYPQNVVNIGLSSQELKNGIALFNDKNYAAAIQAFESSLSYEPQNHAARYQLGLAYLYAGYIQNAVQNWEILVNSGVADLQVQEKLNSLYFQLSKDTDYVYDEPYIFYRHYNGLTEGKHDLIRTSFMIYDKTTDRKFVSSSGAKSVIEMNNANKVVRVYGKRFLRPQVLEIPTGIGIYSNQLYVADYKKNSINVFNRDMQGNFVSSFGTNRLIGPMGIIFSEDGYLYIADNGNHKIHKYLPDGTFISEFGSDFLYRPTDIVAHQGYMYVSDISQSGQGRIVKFDEFGNFIENLGDHFLKQPRGLFLEGDHLYISDAQGSLYVYDLVYNTSRSLMSMDDKLLYPFDVIKDNDSIVWRTDFNSRNLAIYTPLQGVYGNINLSVPQIITDRYPYVYAIVRARNKNGTPLTGISGNELKIKEFDKPIKDVIVSGTEKVRSKMLTHIIIDRSISAQKYLPQLELYLQTFLSNNTGNDLVQITLVDKKITQTEIIPVDIPAIWSFVTNQQPQNQVSAQWDKPIYNGITSLFNKLRNRSVVIFTSGEGEREAFTTYGADILDTYADQNSIPLYVVNFSDQNQRFWEQIAKNSHGNYYHAIRDSVEIIDLYNTIKTSPPLEYLIEYNALNYADTPGLWIDLTLNLNRFGVNGTTITGYFVPTPSLSPGVDLKQEFLP